ncbi:MAG: hypothetical protein IT306_13235 [Chloroflexi bacterium]|nr:hypothetical protein [Chloroflexota bacterium]
MFRRARAVLLFVLVVLQLLTIAPARAAESDPAAFLPPNTIIRQTATGDLDSDGRDDTVTLFSVPGTTPGQPQRGGLLVLLNSKDGIRPVHLFGAPPTELRSEPVLDANGSSELQVRDLVGDGHPRIILTVTNRFPNAPPRTAIWIFGAGDSNVPPSDPDEHGTLPPPWAGAGFRVEAYLEGSGVSIEAAPGGGPAVLRRQQAERGVQGRQTPPTVSETYRWAGDGYRLAERSLALPDDTPTAATPEAAVIAFYAALARGDLAAATALLGDDLQASRSATASSSAPSSIRVEEVRVLDPLPARRHNSQTAPTEAVVAVRVSLPDPRIDLATAEAEGRRVTIGGTWRAARIGESWRLIAADHHQTHDLDALMRQLPAASVLVQTAAGDVRGAGREDVAVLASGPGRFSPVEPYIVYDGPNGLEPGAPISSYVAGGLLGGPGGTVSIADVNADGKAELTFGAVVGAHSGLLWVLQWNGSTLVPLFVEGSNTPVVDLAELDGDGVAEIVLPQSGYCGSYAASPVMTFAFRWQDGAYQPASWRYPTLNDGLQDRADAANHSNGDDPGSTAARACVQHMLALAAAFRGDAAAARAAYRQYSSLRRQAAPDARLFQQPIYLGAPYVALDLMTLIGVVERGERQGWSSTDRAILHDLLGDALLARAQGHLSQAEDAVRRNKPEQEREARQQASLTRQAAVEAYRAALALDPTDEEARRGLGE